MAEESGKRIEVTRVYLQMTRPEEHNPAKADDARARIEQAHNCPASFYRFLYTEVGRGYHWVDRLGWSDEDHRARLAQPGLSLWVMYCDAAPAGYFELEKHADGSIEIAYFGLLQEFVGCGLGKRLLSFAIERAWEQGANRVWLHTCSLDDRAAMPNYLKRGFKPFKQETYFTTISPNEELFRNDLQNSSLD